MILQPERSFLEVIKEVQRLIDCHDGSKNASRKEKGSAKVSRLSRKKRGGFLTVMKEAKRLLDCHKGKDALLRLV